MTEHARTPGQNEDREPDDTLADLEPTEDDADALRGGGPKNQTIQTGGGPED